MCKSPGFDQDVWVTGWGDRSGALDYIELDDVGQEVVATG